MGIVGVFVACFMAAGFDIADEIVNLLISAVVVFMFMCGGNALNDYIDYEIDKTAFIEACKPQQEEFCAKSEDNARYFADFQSYLK